TFEHAVNASTVTADVLAPTATMSTTTAYMGGTTQLVGTAFDENGAVSQARLYDGTTLIASSDAAEQSAAVSALSFTNGGVNWTAGWLPTTAGAHELTFIASDAAGNETKVVQTVAVSEAAVVTPSSNPIAARVTLQPGETRKFLYQVPALPEGNFYIEQYIVSSSYWNDYYNCSGGFTVSAVDAETGAEVALPNAYNGCYAGTYFQSYNGSSYGYQEAKRSLILTVTNTTGAENSINTYFSLGSY
ncbi:hypothetical protein, partial [Deinococcus hohokamensis]